MGSAMFQINVEYHFALSMVALSSYESAELSTVLSCDY